MKICVLNVLSVLTIGTGVHAGIAAEHATRGTIGMDASVGVAVGKSIVRKTKRTKIIMV